MRSTALVTAWLEFCFDAIDWEAGSKALSAASDASLEFHSRRSRCRRPFTLQPTEYTRLMHA